MSTRSHDGHSPTPQTTTLGSPTSSAHICVGSVSNRGFSTLAGVRHRQRCRAPVPRPGPTPPSDPKRPIDSLRGLDEEGVATLHAADSIALADSDRRMVSPARAEIGYVDFLRARYDRAVLWLTEGLDFAALRVEGWVRVASGVIA